MKKDNNNLETLVNQLTTRIANFNTTANEANIQIDQLIVDGIHEAGFDEGNPEFHTINAITRRNLRTDIYHAEDVRTRALQFNASMGATTMSDLARDTIIQLVRNEHIIEQIETVKQIEVDINQILNQIQQEAEPVSKAISEDYYNTRTDCCPTYWTLLSRFF